MKILIFLILIISIAMTLGSPVKGKDSSSEEISEINTLAEAVKILFKRQNKM
jgi:uncharacterized membrane protein